MKKVSIIVPAYNEEKSVNPFYAVLKQNLDKLADTDYEVLFVDDGSADNTYKEIETLHKSDPKVKCLSFSRNFGKEAAIFAGLRAVTGDCCVLLDADLQHPPAVIPEMYEKWLDGYEVVEGVKTNRGKEGILHKLSALTFYHMISKAVGFDMENSSDYKLLDRKVIDSLASLTERNTFFRALSFWSGFKKTTVAYEVQERVAGTTHWSPRSLMRYAVQNVISFTDQPLYCISYLGIIFILVGLYIGIDTLVSYFRKITASGYPTVIFLILISSGCIMLSLGIIGIYISKIYDEIKHRPQYIISRKII